MIIEIKGTGSHNKGAEMMLLTIIQEMERLLPGSKLAVAPVPGSCEYGFYAKLGLYHKAWLEFRGIQFAPLANFIPARIRRMYGLVLDRETDAVLDASGFAYSDQWGELPASRMARYSAKWRKAGKRIVLLPQAFGPFENSSNIRNMKSIIESSDLIYARDVSSYKALTDLAPGVGKIRQAPDFTILFEGKTPSYFDATKHQVCIVPNARMLDKTPGGADAYAALMARGISYLQERQLIPYFLIHGGKEDLQLSQEINSRLKRGIETVDEGNPYFIKGLIKEAQGLFGSRFHSLASALYSGSVAIGTGWSHKYTHLFEDFDFKDGLIGLDISDADLHSRLDLIASPALRERRRLALLGFVDAKKASARAMFEEVAMTLQGK